MPRPPILPVIDYAAVWKAGRTYRQWLKEAEEPKYAKLMEERRRAIVIEPLVAATLKGLPRNVNVLVIAEDWCGDVHRHVPVLEALAAAGKKLRTRYITRMDRKDVFARFLTNGGEAIPKFVFFNHKFVECGNWGPMPAECRRLIARGKAAGDVATARKRIAGIYESDPNGEETITELMELVTTASCTNP